MSAFRALVKKDLVLFLGNRRALLMTLAAPILIAAFFGSLFSGQSQISRVPVAVSDLDRSALTAKIVERLRNESAIELVELDPSAALEGVRSGKFSAAVTLPAGFGVQAPAALFGGVAKPRLEIDYDPSKAMVLPLVRGLMAQHVTQEVSQVAFDPQAGGLKTLRQQVQQAPDMGGTQRDELMTMFDSIARVQQRQNTAAAADAASAAPGAGAGMGVPFSTEERAASGKKGAASNYNSYAHSFAGMTVQFVLLMGVDVGVGLLLLRRSALWQRLRAAPLSRLQVLGSRMASCTLISMGVFVAVFLVAVAAFGVEIQGSLLGFVAVIAAFCAMTAAFGLMIAALGRTPEATRGLAILVTLLLVMLGGAWVPSFMFPPWLQTLSAWTPTYWAVSGLDAMTWRAQPLQAALPAVAALLAFSAAFAALAWSRFQWSE